MQSPAEVIALVDDSFVYQMGRSGFASARCEWLPCPGPIKTWSGLPIFNCVETKKLLRSIVQHEVNNTQSTECNSVYIMADVLQSLQVESLCFST